VNDDNTEVYNTISGVIGIYIKRPVVQRGVLFQGKTVQQHRISGADGDVVTSTTSYTPEIYTSSLTVPYTSIRIEWTGMYSVVDIELSLNDSFNPVSNEYLDISGSPHDHGLYPIPVILQDYATT
jgi:hypothetical protein